MKGGYILQSKNVVGQNVKKYRAQKGYTQEELCHKLELFGLTLYHSDIYLIEYNKRIVKDYEAFALSKALGVSLDEIYNGAEEKLS